MPMQERSVPMSAYEKQEFDKGYKLARELASMVNNSMGAPAAKGFIQGFVTEHPTLQQSMMRLLLNLIWERADSRYYCDGRNQATVDVCKKIKDALAEYNGKPPAVPFI